MTELLWCVDCLHGSKREYVEADFLILVRKGHYSLGPDKMTIDNRVVGVCADCASKKTSFQQDSIQAVDIKNPNLVYKVPGV